MLFRGKGLPGGGQLEIRLVQSMYTSGADELEVAQRARPYDPDSWHVEWTRVAERNETIAPTLIEPERRRQLAEPARAINPSAAT